jgi:ATP-binding cassette subfamily B protein
MEKSSIEKKQGLTHGVTSFLRALQPYLRRYRVAIVLILMVSLLEMAYNALVPLSFKFLIDRALPSRSQDDLLMILLILVGGLVIVSLAALGRDYLYAKVGSGLLSDIRFRMFNHLQFLSMDYYARAQVGDILARFSTDMAGIEHSLTLAIPWGIVPALDVALSTVLLFALDWRLALVAMLVWPFCLIGPRFFAPRATAASYQRKQDEADTITVIQENVSAQGVVKAYGLERPAIAGFGKRNANLLRSSVRLSFLSALMERSAGIGILVLQVLIISAGAYMAFKGYLTIGTLVSFQALFLMLSYGLYNVAQFLPTLVQAGGGMRRIEELLQERPGVSDQPDACPLPRLSQHIALRDVSFSYTGKQPNLKDVNLQISAGWSVAFVGASGSGKSTILNLLMRFYDPSHGGVSFDSHDLRHVTMESLRSQISVVFQENFLFNTTIRENIRVGKLGASDEEVEAAAQAAEIHDFIMTLPEKYEALAGERGGRFSGGQRQRMAIARAILRRPAVLLLDEATSALDVAAEAAINSTLSRVGRGCTVISVTHRLASVTDAQCIYVLNEGVVAEQGKHEDLIAKNGVYARLWRKQSGFAVRRAGERADIEPSRLRFMPILEYLSSDLLAEIAPFFVTEIFPPHRLIVQQGDPGDKFYVIVRGRVEVIKEDATGGARRVAVLEDGDYFGEIALLQNIARTASVRALVPCLCLALHRGHFLNLIERVPDLYNQMVRLAQARNAALDDPVGTENA